MRLVDSAKVIRSKNAGPLQVTLDLMFPDDATYQIAAASPNLTASAVAERYQVALETVDVIKFSAAWAIKIVIDRPVVAGTPGDSDVYGAQQHGPILDIEL